MKVNKLLSFGLIGTGHFGLILGKALEKIGNLTWNLIRIQTLLCYLKAPVSDKPLGTINPRHGL